MVNGTSSGHVRVYQSRYKCSTWLDNQVGQDIDGEAANDWSGLYQFLYQLMEVLFSDWSLSVMMLMVRTQDMFVSISKILAVLWAKVGQDIDGEAAYDYSGYSVFLYQFDGSIVAYRSLWCSFINSTK